MLFGVITLMNYRIEADVDVNDGDGVDVGFSIVVNVLVAGEPDEVVRLGLLLDGFLPGCKKKIMLINWKQKLCRIFK